MKTLIKNGRIVTAVDDYRADILIEDETISVIGKTLEMEADVTIDASKNSSFRAELTRTRIWNCRLAERNRRTIFSPERARRRLAGRRRLLISPCRQRRIDDGGR
jgi:hypothetical protein